MEKLWTSQEVASFLGVDEATIEKLVLDGKITGYRVGGKFLRFRPAEVETLKGQVAREAQPEQLVRKTAHGGKNWPDAVADFFYFNDFYLVAAILLASMVSYLVFV